MIFNRNILLCFLPLLAGVTAARGDDSPYAPGDSVDYLCRQAIGAAIDTVQRTCVFSENGAEITYADPPNISSRALCDARLRIFSWHYQNTETGYNVAAGRHGDTIRINGKKGTKTVQKSHIIDSLPWFQAWEFSLRSFLQHNSPSCEFWMIRPTDMGIFKMIARKKAVETISVNGREEACIKVTLSPSGVLGRLWQATLWYRSDDLQFLKSSFPRGIPGGSPTTFEVVELRKRNGQ
jgi:hypothetical protein